MTSELPSLLGFAADAFAQRVHLRRACRLGNLRSCRRDQWRTSRMVPSSAASEDGEWCDPRDQIEARAWWARPEPLRRTSRRSRSKICCVGHARQLHGQFIQLGKLHGESGQPTWLHSPEHLPAAAAAHQLMVEFVVSAQLASVAPIEKQTATASAAACSDLIHLAISKREHSFSRRLSGLARRGTVRAAGTLNAAVPV